MIIDEKGQVFANLKEACRHHGISDGGSLYAKMKKFGRANYAGHCFSLSGDNVSASGPEGSGSDNKNDDADHILLTRLREKYSEEELQEIASGKGLARPVKFPKVRLTGKHHRMLVISDTHIGSSYSPYEWHDLAATVAHEEKCECVLHCGDLTEGMKIKRIGTQMYELSDLGFEAQRDRAIEMMGKYKLPIYAISGNHDGFFKEYAGADIVKAVSDQVRDMVYLGYDAGEIEVDGAVIRLWHGGDGNSYALSYRLQKVIEAMTGGTKPAILLAGHVHKFCYIFERNVHAISCPCMQSQTEWMRGKKLAAHTGFLVLDFDVTQKSICNLSVKLYPFYR